ALTRAVPASGVCSSGSCAGSVTPTSAVLSTSAVAAPDVAATGIASAAPSMNARTRGRRRARATSASPKLASPSSTSSSRRTRSTSPSPHAASSSDTLRLQPPRAGSQRARPPRPRGRRGDAGLRRPLRVVALLDDAQPQRLAVIAGQLGQPRRDVLAQRFEPAQLLDPLVLLIRQARRREPELGEL